MVVGAGVKLFGNIYIGHQIKVGSNAVAIKDTATGNTAVGISTRVISKLKPKMDVVSLSRK